MNNILQVPVIVQGEGAGGSHLAEVGRVGSIRGTCRLREQIGRGGFGLGVGEGRLIFQAGESGA